MRLDRSPRLSAGSACRLIPTALALTLAGRAADSPLAGDPRKGATLRVAARVQTSVVNPLIRLAFRLGIPDPGDAVLETTGRRTGRRRLTPVCDGLDGDTFWLLSQRGRDADWVRNIEADPRVRVRLRSRRPTKWRSGTAHILDHDDPHDRQRLLSQGKPWRRLCLSTSGALATGALTVRIDLDPEVSSR
jgi:deazaflavin-dependent oxidoreductase (nitroreductase family)